MHMMATGENIKIEIKQNDIVGRYVVASCDLEAGDEILSEIPFAYGPKTDSPPVCLGCYASVDCSVLCSVCGWPVCGPNCEITPAHRDMECSVFANAKAKFFGVSDISATCLQYECITPLRVLLAMETNPDQFKNYINCLESHKEERKTKEIWRFNQINIVNYLRGPCKLQKFDEDLIHTVCGMLDVNAFEARTQSGNSIRCLYPRASIFNHNCITNIRHSIFSDGCGPAEDYRMVIRSAMPLKKGSELFARYAYSTWPTIIRREFLSESKYFECNCKRCEDPTELGTHMSTLKCTRCENGIILSTNPLDQYSDWKCIYCRNILAGITVKTMFKAIQEKIDVLETMPHDASTIKLAESLYSKCISLLHPRNAYITILNIFLVELYEKVDLQVMKIKPEILYVKKIELCQQILENIDIIEPGYSRLRGIIMYQLQAPIILMAKNMYNSGVIDKIEFLANLKNVMDLLKESSKVLSLEPENSNEGALGRYAKKTYDQIVKNFDEIAAKA